MSMNAKTAREATGRIKGIEIPVTSVESYAGEARRRNIYEIAWNLLGMAAECETYPQVLEFHEQLESAGPEMSHLVPFLRRRSIEVTLNYILSRVKAESERGIYPHQVYRDDVVSLAMMLPSSEWEVMRTEHSIDNASEQARCVRSDPVYHDNDRRFLIE